MVQPQHCVGCDLVPRCYHRNCDTSCRLPCNFTAQMHQYRCLLVEHNDCPMQACGWANGPPVDGPPPDS
ncbi:hypothetical protein OESDEN_19311 [Oesophagostomum dentatum]|uniref:Uncharacterized protein n=1 Tax=Oesophagostomum dentatum TaxID=61180 RepID=A0A0B1SBT5_OESDE|nr:hypothetical protein OESDEN_19311 [Oesophagostomum dentatum]